MITRAVAVRLIAVAVILIAAAIGIVRTLTHVVAPRVLTHYEGFPALATAPKRTTNAKGHDGDPVNVAMVGTDSEVATALRRAGWTEAEPITHATSVRIAESVLLHRPDSAAPVSKLFLFGREQDVTFEREVGRSASRRHHVRLWRAGTLDYRGRPVWLGDATFDVSAGLSHRGLHPTHHIDPDVDVERDSLTADLAHVGQVAERFRVTGIGVRVDARNAEGDRFDTDGELRVLVVPPGNVPRAAPAEPPVPAAVRLKDEVWSWTHRH